MAVSGVGNYLWGSTNGMVDDALAWQANLTANFGYILVSNEEASPGSGRRFGSKEQPGGAISPARMIVTYSVVPEPSVAGLWLLALASLTLRRARGSSN